MTPTLVPTPHHRLVSLDAYRAAVILSMVFVNYLPGMPDVPGWLLHADPTVDGFTFTDVVFPGFLFIAGVAIPLAYRRRLERGETRSSILRHLLVRSGSLIFLGVLMVNTGRYDGASATLSGDAWSLLAYLCAIALCLRPGNDSTRQLNTVRAAALVGMGLLLVLYRGIPSETAWSWLVPSWWGILGIIGWAYLTAGGVWLLARGSPSALTGALGLMVALYIGDRHGVLDFLSPIRTWWDVGQLAGSHPAIVTAGVLAGTYLRPDRSVSRSDTLRLAGLGLGLLAGGFLLRPLHGFHKIGGTESYALATAGICTLAFLLFHVGIDRLGFTAGTALLQPVGANPLLAYLLPDVLDKVMGLTGSWALFWPLWSAGGWAGMLNAALMTAAVLGLTWALTRWGIVLRL